MKYEHSDNPSCVCCEMSKRCFLATSAVSTFTVPWVASASMEFPTENEFKQPIELTSFRPKPQVRIMGAVIRDKWPYWLGWPGSSYDVEGHRKEYEKAFFDSAHRIGVTLEILPDPIEDDTALEKFIQLVFTEKPDALLIHIQRRKKWKQIERIHENTSIPIIVWAPLGTVFTTQLHTFARKERVCILSTLDTSSIDQAFRAIRARKQLEHTRLLVVHKNKRNDEVLDKFGTKIRHIPRKTMEEMFKRVPVTEEVREIANEMKKNAMKVVEPSDEDLLNAGRSYVASKHLLKIEEAHAITTDCLGMVTQKTVPTPPCMGACLFQDYGVTYGCEADVFGAFSLMFTSYLFDKPGFMNDPVPETVRNEMITAHCVCGTKLNGFDKPSEPYILRSHAESNLGVSLQVLWKEGQPVTLVRFNNPHELILDTGVVTENIDTPPAGGCRTNFSIKMDNVEESRDVLGFHQVVFYGNHKRDVMAFCQLYGIKVIHSPAVANPIIS